MTLRAALRSVKLVQLQRLQELERKTDPKRRNNLEIRRMIADLQNEIEALK